MTKSFFYRVAALATAFAAIVWIAAMQAAFGYRETVYPWFETASGGHSLSAVQAFPDDPLAVRADPKVVLTADGQTLHSITVRNDGGRLREQNIEVEWTDHEHVVLKIYGCEQPPRRYVVDFTGIMPTLAAVE